MDRAYLKNNAKETLKSFYWTAFIVCLIVGIVQSFSINFRISSNTNVVYWEPNTAEFRDSSLKKHTVFELPIGEDQWGSLSLSPRNSDYSFIIPLNSLLVMIFFSSLALNFAMYFFIRNIFRIGQAKYFIDASHGRSELGSLVHFYRNGKWLSVSKNLFIVDLNIFLWSLLFLIPGIIKTYEYILVPYILAENPDMSAKEAKQLSSRMTDGYKAEIFVLGLSFIGWYLLGTLLCCVGVIFVTPYKEATFAEMYDDLKRKISPPDRLSD